MWRYSVNSKWSGSRLKEEEKGFDWFGFYRGVGGVAHVGGGQLQGVVSVVVHGKGVHDVG